MRKSKYDEAFPSQPISEKEKQSSEIDKRIEFIEVKRQAKNFDEKLLITKSETFMKAIGTFNNYEVIYKGLSIEDM